MSQFSKVNETLRSRILQSLNIYSKTNTMLFFSPIANPFVVKGNGSNRAYSLRAIQEATQKLTVMGVLSRKEGSKNIYEVNRNYQTATV